MARQALRGLHVRDVAVRDPVTTRPDVTIGEFFDDIAWTTKHATYPVTENGHVVGLLPLRSVAKVPRHPSPQLALTTIEASSSPSSPSTRTVSAASTTSAVPVTETGVPTSPSTNGVSIAIAGSWTAVVTGPVDAGTGEDVSDPEIVDGMKLLAETEGILGETAAGVTVATAQKLIKQGKVDPDGETVLAITGNGLKTLDALEHHLDLGITIRPRLEEFENQVVKAMRAPAAVYASQEPH
jgi:hypothetical protein